MKDTFTFSRFGKYFTYDLKRTIAEFGMPALLISLSGVFFYLLYLVFSMMLNQGHTSAPSEGIREGFFMFVFAIFAIVMPSRIYGMVTDKRSGSSYLMIPASTGEKFTSMILNAAIVFPIAFLAIYWLSDALLTLIDTRCGSPVNIFLTELIDNDLSIPTGAKIQSDAGAKFLWQITIMLGFIATPLEFLLGALVFGKHKISMTVLCLIGLSIILSIISIPIALNLDYEKIIDNFSLKGFFWSLLFMQLAVDIVIGLLCWLRLKTIKH